jgi:hypothetical protein
VVKELSLLQSGIVVKNGRIKVSSCFLCKLYGYVALDWDCEGCTACERGTCKS